MRLSITAVAVTAILFLATIMGFSEAFAETACTTIEDFMDRQGTRFPDLIVDKLSDTKAKVIAAFVNKYGHANVIGDMAIVGHFKNQDENRIGYAIFDAGCLVYSESLSEKDWLKAQPAIFGPET
jgi:hypothetical protein